MQHSSLAKFWLQLKHPRYKKISPAVGLVVVFPLEFGLSIRLNAAVESREGRK